MGDPMQAGERALKSDEDRKKQASSALGGDAKRQRATADATTARKELIAGFEPAERFTGVRSGYVFKLGVKGLGYYEDASLAELEMRSAAAARREREGATAVSQEATANTS